MIPCENINQTVNYLLTQFQDCTKLKAEDMQLLVELIAAVNTCANGGLNYDTLNNDIYQPTVDEVITYPPNSFHSISVAVSSGQLLYNGITLSPGNSINLEFTTTNQLAFTFTALAGSTVLVEFITQTI